MTTYPHATLCQLVRQAEKLCREQGKIADIASSTHSVRVQTLDGQRGRPIFRTDVWTIDGRKLKKAEWEQEFNATWVHP